MRSVVSLLLVLALGCDGAPIVYSAGDDTVMALPLEIATDPASAAAFDPHLDGFDAVELRFRVGQAIGATCELELARDGTSLGALDGEFTPGDCSAMWDGRDASGALVTPGVVEVTATLRRGSEEARATTSVEVLRLGVDEVRLGGAGRVAMLYSALDGLRYGYYEVDAATTPWRMAPDAGEVGGAPLELADGTPRARPEPWADLTSPPLDGAAPDGIEGDTFSLPTAWIAGSAIDVSARLTTAHAGGVYDPTLVEVRAVAPEGLSLLDPPEVADGVELSLETSASPVPAVGRYDVTWAWRFEARRSATEAWAPIPGRFETTHRLYGLVAEPIFDYDDVPHRAWVDVVDRVAGWVDGASADPDAVAARIVEGVYLELGLRYDRQAGASHYTDYQRGFETATFELSRFGDLANGEIINCSDAASIVSAYANMLGIDLRYHIIQHQFAAGFELNYLAAIGFEFAASPFTSGRSAFRYHAVVGPPDTRVFDATLAVDGDADPGAAPHERLLVQGLTQDDYLARLSPESENVRVFIDEKVRLR